jgi:hypothetical protein
MAQTHADRIKAAHSVEYILYLWQVEDLVRAAGFDEGVLRTLVEEQGDAEVAWLFDYAAAMQREGVKEQGHTGEANQALTELAMLHDLLLGTLKDGPYTEAHAAALPYLQELEARNARAGVRAMHPIELLCVTLYGWLVLRMGKREVSAETEAAMVAVRNLANALGAGHRRVYASN